MRGRHAENLHAAAASCRLRRVDTVRGTALLHADGAFLGAGDTRITWQSWHDATAPTRAHVVVSHGAAEHGGRYAGLAHALAPRGFPVWALDHRGHGRSEGQRMVVDRLAHAAADVDRLIDRVTEADPGRPIYLLGHSMGGAIALLYALERQDRLAGMVLSAPVTTDAGAPAPLRLAARVLQLDRVLSRFAPSLGLIALDADRLSRDPAEVQAYRDDPLVTLGKLPARTAGELSIAVRGRLRRGLGELRLPLLLVHGDDDALVPLAGSLAVRDRVGSDDVTLLVYPAHRHELLHELPAAREQVLADIAGWLDARAPRRTGRFTH